MKGEQEAAAAQCLCPAACAPPRAKLTNTARLSLRLCLLHQSSVWKSQAITDI